MFDADSLSKELINDLKKSKFIQKILNNDISIKELKAFIVQHYFYSKNFTKFLFLMAANIEDLKVRSLIVENLVDELGLSCEHQTPHLILYEKMLNLMGIEMYKVDVNKETVDLITKMESLCQDKDPIVGLSALVFGAEGIVSHLYQWILDSLIRNGFKKTDLEFFSVHIECDDQHAEVLYNCLDRYLKNTPDKLNFVKKISKEIIKNRIKMIDSNIDKALSLGG